MKQSHRSQFSGSVQRLGKACERLRRLGCFALMAGLGLPTGASLHAQDKTWSGANASWFSGTDWSPSGVPSASDVVEIRSGNAFVTDAGTHGTASAFSLLVGFVGDTGAVQIENGGALSTESFAIGFSSGANGSVIISGAGSSWSNTSGVFVGYVGYDGMGTLAIENGGSFSQTGGANLQIGTTGAGVSSVVVTGPGSSFSLSGALNIGIVGEGEFTVEGNATAIAANVQIGDLNGVGRISLSGGGVLQTAWINADDGNGSVDFTGGVLRASQNEGDMLRIQDAGKVTLHAASGGGFIDTNGFDVGISAVIGGGGVLTKQGAGTLTLSGSNTFAGGVVLESGALMIVDLGDETSVLGTGSVDVQASGTLGGHGAVLGNTTVEGTLAPDSTGEIAFAADLTLTDTADTRVTIASLSDFSRLSIGGAFTYDGTLSIGFANGYLPGLDDEFALFDLLGTYAAGTTFDNIVFNVAGYEAQMDYATGVLTISAVPEPSTAMLLAAACAGGFLFLRRRRA